MPLPATTPGVDAVWLIGYALLAALCARLSVLALRLRTRVARVERSLWGYFGLIGLVGTLAGLAGLVWIAVGGVVLGGVVDALALAFALLCALAMREAYVNAALSNAENGAVGQPRPRRAVEVAFGAAVVGVGAGPLLVGPWAPRYLAAVAGVAVVVYGLYFQRKRARGSASRGTLIDTLLRQLAPALAFLVGSLLASLLELVAVDAGVVAAVTAALVVMTGSALVSVTIKFRQHLAVQG